jgi:hypothetical protein
MSNTGGVNGFLLGRAIRRAKLSARKRILLEAIMDRAGTGESSCWASYRSLADDVRGHRQHVYKDAKALAKAGWLVIRPRRDQRGDSDTNLITMGPQLIEAVKAQAQLEEERRVDTKQCPPHPGGRHQTVSTLDTKQCPGGRHQTVPRGRHQTVSLTSPLERPPSGTAPAAASTHSAFRDEDRSTDPHPVGGNGRARASVNRSGKPRRKELHNGDWRARDLDAAILDEARNCGAPPAKPTRYKPLCDLKDAPPGDPIIEAELERRRQARASDPDEEPF